MEKKLDVGTKLEVIANGNFCQVVVDGNVVVENCDGVEVLPNGNFKTLYDGIWTLRNNENQTVLVGKDAVVYESKDGMIRVFNGEKYAYWVENSRVKWPFIFDEAEDFHNGIAKVVFKGETRTISKEGKFID